VGPASELTALLRAQADALADALRKAAAQAERIAAENAGRRREKEAAETDLAAVKRQVALLPRPADPEAPGRPGGGSKAAREVGRWFVGSRTFRMAVLAYVACVHALVYFAAFRRFLN
jgi:hypothetical protein